jgi:hypothetical protein
MLKSNFLLSLLAFTALAGTASATTTLQFSVTNTARATGFSDSAGLVGVNGMRWGIVIDTAGDGFDGGTVGDGYATFDNSVSGFLSKGAAVTDDYFFTPASLPTTSTQTATGTDPGGAGGIVSAALAPNGTDLQIPGVTTADPFAIIWFESAPNVIGANYGLFNHPSFLLPASGTSVSFASVFAGASADPIKAANLEIAGIPEPSRGILLLGGILGLALRRRRA